jgi:fumarate reductase subunit C
LAHRFSGLVLAVLVTVHIVTIIVAVQGGLSATEILSRTRGSLVWGGFYSLFVLAAALHGAIGVRSFVREMTPWRARSLDWAALGFCLLLVILGLRAVGGVVA